MKNYRSRLVAMEFNNGKNIEGDLFGATPPIKGLRTVVSAGPGQCRVRPLARDSAYAPHVLHHRMCPERPRSWPSSLTE